MLIVVAVYRLFVKLRYLLYNISKRVDVFVVRIEKYDRNIDERR